MSKRVLITGVSGQTGSYLAEQCLADGEYVFGLVRRSSASPQCLWRIAHLLSHPRFQLIHGDVTDNGSMGRALRQSGADEVYNLAAQSYVADSFTEPGHTWGVTAGGVMNLLEEIRVLPGDIPRPKVFQASSSEMFGGSYSVRDCAVPSAFGGRETINREYYQDEKTPFRPNSPYAIAKLAAHHLCRVYRESYGIFISCGIMFNHESPRRGEEFVTRKITRHIARLLRGETREVLRLGNIKARRDWGYAGDYVRAMRLMLKRDEPGDWVIATGEDHSVEDFARLAFEEANLSYEVIIDENLYRPCEVPRLKGEPSKAMRELGWGPMVTFAELVRDMVMTDIERAT